MFIRAPIDRPISRESSASSDLVCDRAGHPVWSLTLIVAPRSRNLDSVSTSPQWQSSCCNLRGLARPLLTQVSLCPLPLAVAARQQRWHGPKVINKDWRAWWSGVGLMDTREIARISRQQRHENRSPQVATIRAVMFMQRSFTSVHFCRMHVSRKTIAVSVV